MITKSQFIDANSTPGDLTAVDRALETGSNMILFHNGSFLPVLEKIIGPNYWEVAEPIFNLLKTQEHLKVVPLNAFMSRPDDKHMGIAGTFCPRNAQLDGFVVIAETREICKKIIVEFNSGLRKSVEKLISIVPERKSTFSNN